MNPEEDKRFAGTQGYDDTAEQLVEQHKNLTFEQVLAPVLHLFPKPPARILDVGSGAGRDAVALAGDGHNVTAVEPSKPRLDLARKQHEAVAITWIEDGLPDLASLETGHDERFDLILLNAVWMHLERVEREPAMHRLNEVLSSRGRIIMSLRHGAIPEGRHMFHVSGDETIDLAERCGLKLALRADDQPSSQPNNPATWTWLAFIKSMKRARLR